MAAGGSRLAWRSSTTCSAAYDERRRAELVAAFMVVEHAAEPVQEARFAGLRDPALRRTLGEMLARRGRTLIQHRERWTSGYDDEACRPRLAFDHEVTATGSDRAPGRGGPKGVFVAPSEPRRAPASGPPAGGYRRSGLG